MLEVKVCIGTSCHLRGSYNVLMSFKQLIEQYNLHDKVNLAGQFCTGCCQNGVSVTIGDTNYSVSAENATTFFKDTIMPMVADK
jgi:NADH:ubiquinone oxidoreductase subunit E